MANFTPEEYERRMAARLLPKVKKVAVKNPIRTLKTEIPQYLVYAVRCSEVVVYVGSGKVGRERHCQSGCSHVYELNRLHFSGEDIETSIVERFNTREDALQSEKLLIMQLRPKLNKMYNPDAPKMVNSAVQKEWEAYFATFPESKSRHYKKLLRFLLSSFGVNNLISTKGVALACISKRDMGNLLYTFLRCKEGSKLHDKYKILHELFLSEPGYIKVPKAPPKLTRKLND